MTSEVKHSPGFISARGQRIGPPDCFYRFTGICVSSVPMNITPMIRSSFQFTVVAFSAALLLSCAPAQNSIYGLQGFSEAYFDTATLTAITSNVSCVRVRFYDSRRAAADTKGTAMAIGVSAAQGPELYVDPTYKYQQYNVLNGTKTTMNVLTRAAALSACNYVVTAGDKLYKTEFTKQAILTMLGTAGCNGLKVTALQLANGNYSMSIAPVSIVGSVATVIAGSVPLVCTDPCPSLCGPPANYVK
jgi:hypothetical protein